MKSPKRNVERAELAAVLLVLLVLLAGTPAYGIDVWNYWLGPHGSVTQVENLTWSGQTIPGRHVFWRGSKWGKTVALQGDPSMTRYDIFVENGDILEYWGTFRGNDVDDDDSHSFDSPFRWMNSSMAVGQAVEHTVPLQLLDSQQRRWIASDNVYLDFNDGIGLYGTFTDAQAMSSSTGRWELKEATVTVPLGVGYIKVRAVRDGANQGNAYFDRITLQRIN